MNEIFTVAESGSILVTAKGVKLPSIPAKFFMLSNWNVSNDDVFIVKAATEIDGEKNAELEVFWGFGGVYAHQLFPSETTPLIPAGGNLKNVCLRSRAGQTLTIWFSYFN